MRRLISSLMCVLAMFCPAAHAGAHTASQAKPQMVRVFLDCNRCDEDYVKKEVTFIDYVRNREDADVHVLVTTQETGGGGSQWTLKFIGLGAKNQGQDQTLTYNSSATATGDEVRAGFVEVFKLGLVRYAVNTPIVDRLRVTFKKAEGDAAKAGAKKDPWNYWVFRVNAGGDFNGEESSTGRSVRGSFSANRTTDAWRMSFNASANYRDNKYVLDPTDPSQTILSVSRSTDASGTAVKSLSPHWSLGILGSASASTFRNYALNTRVAPGIEYDLFPYSESTRRMLTFQYTVGYQVHRYREETIFGKMHEQLPDHRGEIGLSLRQPWGSAQASVSLSQYLNDMKKYSLGVFGGTNVRLFKGFSFNMFGEYSRTRDQIYLPKGTASTEDILLRQRQLFTGYQYFFNFGINYSFGSIFNNIVNPRFGGVGCCDF
jgi:hypothetical protein